MKERAAPARAAKLALICRSEREEDEEMRRRQQEGLEIEALLEGNLFLEIYISAMMKTMAATQALTMRFGRPVPNTRGGKFFPSTWVSQYQISFGKCLFFPKFHNQNRVLLLF